MFVAIVQSTYLLACRGSNRSETACPQTMLATRQAHAHILCHYAGLKSVKLSCRQRSLCPLTPGVLPLSSALLSFCCDSYITHVSLKYCSCCVFRNSGKKIFFFFFLLNPWRCKCGLVLVQHWAMVLLQVKPVQICHQLKYSFRHHVT